MKFKISYDVIILALASFIFYSISYTSLQITEKSPSFQRNQSYIFPSNFSQIQTPLYKRFIYLILDGMTYDYVDKRVKDIPFIEPGCEIHTHQISIFNELLNKNPQSVVFQRLEIEEPPKTEIKIATYLKGVNPAFFTMKAPKADPYQIPIDDSIFYQLGQSDTLKRNYGFLTYFLYNYIGFYLNRNQYALNPDLYDYEQMKQSEIEKINEYTSIIKSNNYDTLFIYGGLFDEVAHMEGMHTEQGRDAQKQIDKIIRGIVENMDDEAILMITSDHGKSETGSHFSCKGEDIKTCNSMFFAYTQKGFIQEDSFIQSIRRKEKNERISSQAGQFSTHESMISSTISNILNIPISFINSGRSLFEVYPASKFANRLEMLQRILQDSFSTLQQQKQFYQTIQKKTSIFDQFEFKTLFQKITKIENELFYEQRDMIIYNEEALEQMILKIISLQNEIQESIYNTQFYSIRLMIFGIIIGGVIALKIMFEYLIRQVIRKRKFKNYLFMITSTALSFYIYFMNEKSDLKYYGSIISSFLVLFLGINEFKKSGKPIVILMFVGLNLSITMLNSFKSLQIISVICEMMIFGFHSKLIISEKGTQDQRNQTFLQISLAFAAIEGILRFKQEIYLCFALNLIFYIYSMYIKNRISLNFLNRDHFQVDLMMINIFWCFLGLFSNHNYLVQTSKYYPIVIANLYLLGEVASARKCLQNSFYLQVHAIIMAAILFQLFNFQISYYDNDFNLLQIVLYYLPLPFVTQIIKTKPKKQQIAAHQGAFHENDYENQGILGEQEIENIKLMNSAVENVKLQKHKSGIILFSAITMLCSCIGELWVIRNKQIYIQSGDNFIFLNNYLMASVVAILISNIFVN